MSDFHFQESEHMSLTLKQENPEPTISIDGTEQESSLSLGQVATITGSYEALTDKPSIEGHVLVKGSSLPEIGVEDVTEQDIDQIIFG